MYQTHNEELLLFFRKRHEEKVKTGEGGASGEWAHGANQGVIVICQPKI